MSTLLNTIGANGASKSQLKKTAKRIEEAVATLSPDQQSALNLADKVNRDAIAGDTITDVSSIL